MIFNYSRISPARLGTEEVVELLSEDCEDDDSDEVEFVPVLADDELFEEFASVVSFVLLSVFVCELVVLFDEVEF